MAGPPSTPRPVVGTGFAEAGPEARNLPADHTLETGGRYRFWLQIGPEHPSSIERKPKALPSTVPVGSLLTVTLVGASEGAEVLSPAEAELCLLSDGAMPARPQGPTLSPQERRLFFEVRTPPVPGEAQWRCSIYWRGGLVQSRLVRAVVTPGSFVLPRALSSELDYSLADPGDPATLAEVGEHDGSLTLSGRSDATHVLTIRAGTDSAGPPLRAELRLDEGTIAQAIRRARAALRTAAWGDEEPWDERRPEQRYRHTLRADPARLAADLTGLAVAGYRLHWTLAQELAREAGTDLYAARDLLASALGRAGTVQVAVLRSARHVLPAALLYDLPLDTNAPALTLCPDFAEAYRNGPAAVGGAPCFSGGCRQAVSPSLTVVCPAGFWGFRHSLGLPLSAGPGRSAVARLTVDEPFRIGIGLYTGFPTAQFHCEALAALRPGTEVRTARSRAEVGGMLAGSPSPHLVYFYCHGGLTASGTPFLRVGDDRSDEVLTPDNLYAWGVHWSGPRPLVFLNGCRTADLEPEQLLDFAGSFVTAAGASGLIGTEITVFEEMAGAFAKEFLRLFLDGRPAGEAVLLARRGLLAQGNPLGLAYVPFLPPQLTVGGEPARWRQRIGSSLKTRISRSTRA